MLPNTLTPQLPMTSAALYTPPHTRTAIEENKAELLYQTLDATKSNSILSLDQITQIKNISSQLIEEDIHCYKSPQFSDGSQIRVDVSVAESIYLQCILPDGNKQYLTLGPTHPAYSYFSRTTLETRSLDIIPEEHEDSDSLASYVSLSLDNSLDICLDELEFQRVISPLITSEETIGEDEGSSDHLTLTHPPSSVLPAYQPYSPPPAPYIGAVSSNQQTSTVDLVAESEPFIAFSVLVAQNTENTNNNITPGLIIDAMELHNNNNYSE